MRYTKRMLLSLAIGLIAATCASAQARRVALKPTLLPGQEVRYAVNVSIETRVIPSGDDGIASAVHKESTATVVLRGVAADKGESSIEATVEAFSTRTTVDGVDAPDPDDSPIGQKVEYELDVHGRAIRMSFPQAAGRAGLAEMLFNLARWIPSSEVSVGQSWGQSIAIDSLAGDYGYVAAPSIAEIPKRATVSYRLSSLDGNTAVIDGAINLNQSGSCILTTKQGRINVTGIAEGKGNTRVSYDLNAGYVTAATTETTFEGRIANIAPTRDGEKLKPREGSIVETARFSIKLAQ
jgi:hypothetical protein